MVQLKDGYNPKWSWTYNGDFIKQNFYVFRFLVKIYFSTIRTQKNLSEIAITNLSYNYRPEQYSCITLLENKFDKLKDGILETYGAAFDGVQAVLKTKLIKKNNYTDPNCFHLTIQDRMGQAAELESGSPRKFTVTFPIAVMYNKSLRDLASSQVRR